MQVVETIGSNNQTFTPTPFYYKRTISGVAIRNAIGTTNIDFIITHEEWKALLERIYAQEFGDIFGVTGGGGSRFRGPVLYEIIESVLNVSSDQKKAYVSAVLVHEGVFVPYHGQLDQSLFDQTKGFRYEARVFLKRSAP